MYRNLKVYTNELVIFILLVFCCLFNYYLQQLFKPFLLPLNSIVFAYLILNKFTISIVTIIICALLDEQLLGYHLCSLVTIYSLICFLSSINNKYKKFTFILSFILWCILNYNTPTINTIYKLFQ